MDRRKRNNLILALIMIAFVVLSFKAIVTQPSRHVLVVTSFDDCKKLMDIYFKSGYELERMETQVTGYIPNATKDGWTNINSNGAKIKTEYLLIFKK